MERSSVRWEANVGDLRRLSVTLPQAAHILKVDVRRIRKAIDRHRVAATLVWQGQRATRRLDGVDILCLRMEGILTKALNQEIYARLKQAPDRERLERVLVDPCAGEEGRDTARLLGFLSETAAETVADIRSLDDFARFIDDDGWIRAAGVEAHRIAALVEGGMSPAEVMDDYSNLDGAQIEAALNYARVVPKQGRPYPTRTAKSVLRHGGGGGLAAAMHLEEEKA